MYKLTKNESVIIFNGNTFIPKDEANVDYQEYLNWLAEGNTPEPDDEVAL